ncbi:hypothetical protein EYC84_002261 [Monilinia fructicola]|uniref:AB hydrolase-1 domain-containing protein n=1 Tax=Monilinia fructicola TaxID=38448 RepID=A0A5M9JQ36_MONFR|nr:hypothetical protein EYC84_002261 [Monilinia fructicola]
MKVSRVRNKIRTQQQPENPFASLIPDQTIAIIPSFTLESGETLHNIPLAYSTRGKLSPNRDNAMVICHALTGSADFGKPYGSASPVTYDVNIHKLLLDDLGVRQVAAVIGGSMGGMLVLEWAYFGKEYVRAIVPIATSSRHSAWGISWGEAQRQSIYADPKYDDGYYPFSDPPTAGLGAARMSALLTYRSLPWRNSIIVPTTPERPQTKRKSTSHYFSAQSYLRYQGEKYRVPADSADPIAEALAQIQQPTLVLGIESDGLFTFDEQKEIAASVPMHFEQVNQHILEFLNEVLPDIMEAPGVEGVEAEDGVGAITKSNGAWSITEIVHDIYMLPFFALGVDQRLIILTSRI